MNINTLYCLILHSLLIAFHKKSLKSVIKSLVKLIIQIIIIKTNGSTLQPGTGMCSCELHYKHMPVLGCEQITLQEYLLKMANLTLNGTEDDASKQINKCSPSWNLVHVCAYVKML